MVYLLAEAGLCVLAGAGDGAPVGLGLDGKATGGRQRGDRVGGIGAVLRERQLLLVLGVGCFESSNLRRRGPACPD